MDRIDQSMLGYHGMLSSLVYVGKYPPLVRLSGNISSLQSANELGFYIEECLL